MTYPTISRHEHASPILGAAWIPEISQGINISAHGYTEEEFLLETIASEWTYDADWQRQPLKNHHVTTRVVVRRPTDTERSSGIVSLEPLHPNLDRPNSWRHSADWIMRSGHTWVGVTQEKTMGEFISTHFPERYSMLRIPAAGLGYDLLGQVSQELHRGAFGFAVEHIILSGWSATGSICRVYAQEGFLRDYTLDNGRPSINGIVIGISSGAAHRAGYPVLHTDGDLLPLDHPRRTISLAPVPIFEVLSEYESETHWPVLRPDTDEPTDRYRLYQVAGTSHANLDTASITNEVQFREVGLDVPVRSIAEEPSDGSLSIIAVALYEAMLRWVIDGIAPPKGQRLQRSADAPVKDAVAPLTLDEHGNAIDGIRTPWVEAPLAQYLPHSTPDAGYTHVGSWTPHSNAAHAARLVGHMERFTEEQISNLYADFSDYDQRFSASVNKLVQHGYLLEPEATALKQSTSQRWDAALSHARGSARDHAEAEM